MNIIGQETDGTFTVLSDAGQRSLTSTELPQYIAEREATEPPRWVLTSVPALYPLLLRTGVRIHRCHDLALAEGILLAYEGREGEPKNLAAALARTRGQQGPPDTAPADADEQPTLFDNLDSGLPHDVSAATAAREVFAEQERRISASEHPQRLRLLIAAESASALAAAEMSQDGLPWRAGIHSELLTRLLGPRPPAGSKPRRLVELAAEIGDAFGQTINPDHPHSVVRAFARVGIDVPSARAHVVRRIEHLAVPPLLHYKELSRLYSAHGWSWLEHWVSGGRFRPNYVVGGVVSGRWASKGGAALQIPKTLRVCVRADPGWKLVIADGAQLEPRILAALSGDRKLAEVSASTDLYSRLAEEMFAHGRPPVGPRATEHDDRSRAKIAMLSAMYGGTSGEAATLLALLRQRFPVSVSYVEAAAQAGERGERVRSRLGRTSPAPSAAWRALTGGNAEDTATEGKARRAARDWGRFTRNFVVQASAADWTALLLATLRQWLPQPAHLVFFQHDEVLVHTPDELAESVCALIDKAAKESTRLMFGPQCTVRFPMLAVAVDCYADAK